MRFLYNEYIVVVLFSLIILTSCNSYEERQLNQALFLAGHNSLELQKVLKHYADDPEKQEAARFLIRNMPKSYGYEGWQLDSVMCVLAQGAKDKFISKYEINKWKDISFNTGKRVFDLETITASYLIENIDLAFMVYKKYPWNKTLPFSDFCELILPYRIGNEVVTNWRKVYYDLYSPLLDSLYPDGRDVVEACHIIANELKKNEFFYFTDINTPHYDALFLLKNRIGYCRDGDDLALYAMRACGIPVAVDAFIYSPEYQNSHSWCVVRDTTGEYLPFDFAVYEARRDKVDDRRKKGKIYRSCYGLQDEPIKGITANHHIPSLFRDRFIKDVTANYTGENKISISVDVSNIEFAYLSIFSPNGWIPIDMSQVRNSYVTFNHVEPDIIYQVTCLEKNVQQPIGYPFIYFANNNIHYLKPDTTTIREVVLNRKMGLVTLFRNVLNRCVPGSKIEAANTLSFKDSQLIYQFKDTVVDNYIEIKPLLANGFRYIQYHSSPGEKIELAELSLYRDSMGKNKIPLSIVNNLEPKSTLNAVIDGDILSYFSSQDTSCAITFDMGRAERIERIIFSPRNDDNFVWPGDKYELFYHNGLNGWVSLGVQTAAGRQLHYRAPENALLWLRNLTKGREEQVFFMHEGKQVFTYDIGR